MLINPGAEFPEATAVPLRLRSGQARGTFEVWNEEWTGATRRWTSSLSIMWRSQHRIDLAQLARRTMVKDAQTKPQPARHTDGFLLFWHSSASSEAIAKPELVHGRDQQGAETPHKDQRDKRTLDLPKSNHREGVRYDPTVDVAQESARSLAAPCRVFALFCLPCNGSVRIPLAFLDAERRKSFASDRCRLRRA